jgi:hypothetical protein
MTLNLLYFVGGILTALMGLYVIGQMGDPPKKVIPRKWSKLDSMEWEFSFDYSFDTPETATVIGRAMCHAMLKKVEEKPMSGVTIDPGHYSIRFSAIGHLTRREP